MARVIKLLWRLDYNVAFGLLDKRGIVLRTLLTEVESYWQHAGTGPLPDSLVASYIGESEARNISVELNSCNGSIEWPLGQDLDRVLSADSFRQLSKILGKILNLCDINAVARAGLRLILVERIAPDATGREAFSRETSNFYVRSVENSIGRVTDIGIVLEGQHEDGVGYKLQFGPTAKKNIAQNLTTPHDDEATGLLSHELFFDIDLYENNFSFREHTLHKWAITKVDKISELMKKCRAAGAIG